MRDFDVTVKLRNNHLVERREVLGMSAPQLAVAAGIRYGTYLRTRVRMGMSILHFYSPSSTAELAFTF
jgi:hypothetical protein